MVVGVAQEGGPTAARPVRLDSGAWGYRTAGGGWRRGDRASLLVTARSGKQWTVAAVCISAARSGTAVWVRAGSPDGGSPDGG